MPIALIMVSLVSQPVMVARYAVVAGLGGAAIVAYSLSRLRDRYAAVAVVSFLLISGWRLRALSGIEKDFETDVMASIRSVAAELPEGASVVAVSAHAAYPIVSPLQLARYEPALVDFQRGEEVCGKPGVSVACDGVLINRDVSRIHSGLFGFPPLAPLDSLRTLELVYVIEREDPRYRAYDSTLAARMFRGYTSTRIAPTLYAFAKMGVGGGPAPAVVSRAGRPVRRPKGKP
jgi:hypothetical protein